VDDVGALMDAISGLLGTIAWPIVVLILITTYRPEIGSFFGRVTRLAAPGFEAEAVVSDLEQAAKIAEESSRRELNAPRNSGQEIPSGPAATINDVDGENVHSDDVSRSSQPEVDSSLENAVNGERLRALLRWPQERIEEVQEDVGRAHALLDTGRFKSAAMLLDNEIKQRIVAAAESLMGGSRRLSFDAAISSLESIGVINGAVRTAINKYRAVADPAKDGELSSTSAVSLIEVAARLLHLIVRATASVAVVEKAELVYSDDLGRTIGGYISEVRFADPLLRNLTGERLFLDFGGISAGDVIAVTFRAGSHIYAPEYYRTTGDGPIRPGVYADVTMLYRNPAEAA